MAWQPAMTASGRARGYTTLDLVVIAVLGAVFGLLNTPFGLVFQFLMSAGGPVVQTIFQPWAIGMVLSMFIVRKPGAALLNGFVNGLFQLLTGNPAGLLVFGWTLANGLGVEIGFALYLYIFGSIRFTWVTALVSGFLAMAFGYVVSAMAFNFAAAGAEQFWIGWIGQAISGALWSGLIAYILGQILARSGLLKSFSAGQSAAAAT